MTQSLERTLALWMLCTLFSPDFHQFHRLPAPFLDSLCNEWVRLDHNHEAFKFQNFPFLLTFTHSPYVIRIALKIVDSIGRKRVSEAVDRRVKHRDTVCGNHFLPAQALDPVSLNLSLQNKRTSNTEQHHLDNEFPIKRSMRGSDFHLYWFSQR